MKCFIEQNVPPCEINANNKPFRINNKILRMKDY